MDLKDLDIQLPKPKVSICIRIDQEIINWFKDDGRGYQTKINAVLMAYVQAQKLKDKNDEYGTN